MNGNSSGQVGGRIIYDITANIGPFRDALAEAEKEAEKAGQDIEDALAKKSKGALSKLGSEVMGLAKDIGSTMAGIASSTATAFTMQGIQDTKFLENTQIQLIGLTHSVEDGSKAMAMATKYFKNNPFNRFDVTSATKNLIQFGAELDNIPTLLDKMGKVSLSTGTNISELAYLYQRSSSDGRVGLIELNMLANKGVPIWDALAKAAGLSAMKVREMTRSAGGLDASIFQKAFDYLVDDEAMERYQMTLDRQLDRFRGRLSNIRGAITGYTMDMEKGLIINENGLYRAYVSIFKSFADAMDSGIGQRIYAAVEKLGNYVGKYITKFANTIPKLLDKLATVLEYLAENGEMLIPILGGALVMFGRLGASIPGLSGVIGPFVKHIGGMKTEFGELSGPLQFFIGLFAVGFMGALKDPAGREALGQITKALGDLVTALTPAIVELTKIITTLTGKAVVPILQVAANALSGLASIISKLPTPVLTAFVGAIGGLVVLKKVVEPIKSISNAAAGFKNKAVETMSRSLTTGIVSVFKTLGNNAVPIIKGAGVLAAIGLGIGVFIGAIGGGIWLFGQGMKAIGEGFGALASGISDLNKVNADRLPEVISKLRQALSGLIWSAGSFATAALTFGGIGEGLKSIAEGLVIMRDIDSKDFNKLSKLGGALKNFQIGFFENIFGGNILTKFKDVGDTIKSIAELCNIVANLKVEDEKLEKSLKSLANGLKAFMIIEIKPGFFHKLFVEVEYKSVTDYLESLKNIVGPVQEFAKLAESKNFDSDKLTKFIAQLGLALHAFMSVELKPGLIQKIFVDIDYRSVLDYVENLGKLIEPLNDLYTLTQRTNFDGDKFTKFIDNLGKALHSFTILEMNGVFGTILGGGFTRNKLKGVLDYLDNLGTVVKGLDELYSLMARAGKDSGKFTEFVESIGKSLQSFVLIEERYSIATFLGGGFADIKLRGVLEFFNGFGEVVKQLAELQKIFDSTKDKSSDFASFVGKIGEALQSFTTADQRYGLWTFLGGGFQDIKVKGIIEFFKDFGIVVEGLKGLQGIFSTKDFKSGDFTNFVKKIGEALQAFMIYDVTDIIASPIFGRFTKATAGSVIEHLKGFKEVADSLIKLGQSFNGENAINPDNLAKFIKSLAEALQLTIFETESTDVQGIYALIAGGVTYNKKMQDSIFNHLGNFKEFVEAVTPLFSIEGLGDKNNKILPRLESFLETVIEVLSLSTFTTETSKNETMFALIAGGHSSFKETYDSIFNHLKDFKSFTEGIRNILDIGAIKEYDSKIIGSLKRFLKSIIEVLNLSTFSTEYEYSSNKEVNAILSGSKNSKTEKAKWDSIFNHLKDFKTFTDGLKDLLTIQDLGKDKIENMENFLIDLMEILNLSTFPTEMETAAGVKIAKGEVYNIQGGESNTSASIKQDSIFNHLAHFQSFANGLKTLLEIQDLGEDKISSLKKFVIDLAEALFQTTLPFETTSKGSSESGSWGFGGADSKASSSESWTKYDSIFNHLEHFESFTRGVKNLLEILPQIDDTTMKKLEDVVGKIVTAITKSAIFTAEQSNQGEEKTSLFTSTNWNNNSKFASILEHLGQFESFASGIKTFAETISSKDFNLDTFKKSLTNIFGALTSLVLQEEEWNNNKNNGWGTGESSTGTKTWNFGLLDRIEDITKIVNIIERLKTLNITADNFGATFKTNFENIVAGLSSLASLDEVSWENIDTDKMGKLNEIIGVFKTTMTEWETGSLNQQAQDIVSFIATYLAAFSNEELIATVLTNADLLGQKIPDSINSGLTKAQEAFKTNFGTFIKNGYEAGLNLVKTDLETFTTNKLIGVIADKIKAEGSANTIKSAINDVISTAVTNAADSAKTSAEKIGENVSSGVSAGISNTLYYINAAGKLLSDAAINRVKSLLGIASPSKVFYEIGQNMGEGLVLGLGDMAEDVAEAASDMVSKINTEFQGINGVMLNGNANNVGNGGGSVTRNNNIVFNNNISSGLDLSTLYSQLSWELSRA